MKIALVLAALVAVAVAGPLDRPASPIPILQYDEKRDDFGQFSLSYLTGDGLSVTRQGVLEPSDDGKGHVLVQSGSEMYTAPDGTPIKTVWSAGKDGYEAKGDHLPVAPLA